MLQSLRVTCVRGWPVESCKAYLWLESLRGRGRDRHLHRNFYQTLNTPLLAWK